MRILLDMDDIITWTSTEWLRRYNERFNDDKKIDYFTEWNWDKCVPCGYKIYDLLLEKGFYRNLAPIDGAIMSTRELVERGDDVLIMSAAPHCSLYASVEKQEWLEEHMPFFNIDNLIIGHRKDVVDCDVMFDDGPHNLANTIGKAVCMNRPWNIRNNLIVKRVNSWRQFMSLSFIKNTAT